MPQPIWLHQYRVSARFGAPIGDTCGCFWEKRILTGHFPPPRQLIHKINDMPQGNEICRGKLLFFNTGAQGIDNKAIYSTSLAWFQRPCESRAAVAAITPYLMHKVIHKRLVAEKELKKPQLSKEINVLH